VPIAAVCQYLVDLLDGLAMPEDCPAMASYLLPPDPNVETQIPTAYVWPSDFDEARDPRNGGSMPRNSGPGTFCGVKTITHATSVFVVWMGANDDPLFPGIVDFTMKALRFAFPLPLTVTDPYDGTESQISDVGEVMRGKIFVEALADQAYNRYDSQLTVPVVEEISA
jgi:hypothetical protein